MLKVITGHVVIVFPRKRYTSHSVWQQHSGFSPQKQKTLSVCLYLGSYVYGADSAEHMH